MTKTHLPGLSQYFDNNGAGYTIAKPYGPTLLEAQLPDDIFSRMLELTDSVLADKQRVSYGKYLVGQIKEEPEIPEASLKEHGVYDYIRGMFAEYVIGTMYGNADRQYQQDLKKLQDSGQFRNPVKVNLEAAWIVSQMQGEYNPIHNHSLSTLSSVMYLKVPETLQKEVLPDKIPVDGNIELVDRSADQMQNSSVRIAPQPGRFYIFPATLLHLVYPFHSNEERRSVSINASYQL